MSSGLLSPPAMLEIAGGEVPARRVLMQVKSAVKSGMVMRRHLEPGPLPPGGPCPASPFRLPFAASDAVGSSRNRSRSPESPRGTGTANVQHSGVVLLPSQGSAQKCFLKPLIGGQGPRQRSAGVWERPVWPHASLGRPSFEEVTMSVLARTVTPSLKATASSPTLTRGANSTSSLSMLPGPESGLEVEHAAATFHSESTQQRTRARSPVTECEDLLRKVSEVIEEVAIVRRISLQEAPRRARAVVSEPRARHRPRAAPDVETRAMEGRERSERLLDCLYDLRRLGIKKDAEGELDEKALAEKFLPKIERGLLKAVLSDCEDTVESLVLLIEGLQGNHIAVGAYGGSRHATSVITKRVLQVAERKLQVLRGLCESMTAVEEVQRKVREVIAEVLSARPVGEVLGSSLNFPGTLKKSAHKRGEPQNEQISDFGFFASRFGLPSEHAAVKRGQKIIEEQLPIISAAIFAEAEKQVADETSRGVFSGAAAENCRILERLAEKLGLQALEVEKVAALAAVAAGSCILRFADAEWIKDDWNRQQNQDKGEPCMKSADKIDNLIKDGIAWGLDEDDPRLLRAKKISKDFRAERLRRFANYVTRTMRPGLGEAGRVGDQIEEAFREALHTFGVSISHPSMVEARKFAQEATALEFDRKKEHARAQREADKAKAKAKA